MTQQNVVVSDTKSGVSLTVFSTTSQKPPAAPGGYISIPRMRVLKNLEINGGQRINAWVESMRASSPTHHKSTPLSEEHNSWILHHPSALDMFDQIIEASKGKQIVMFLDYDGTLSPIVDDPDRAFMSDSMRKTVRKLARCFPTAIVTGRCKDKVYNFVRLAELYYAGSHGMDIKGPTRSSKYNKDSKAEAILCQPASDFLPMIDEVYQQLVEKTKSTPGALVENNKFCLSVHFRCVDEKKWSELARQVKSVLKEYPKLRLTQGRKGPHCNFAGPTSGSTACVAIIRNNKLFVANAGDSRCVVCRKGQAYDLSIDHKLDLEIEKERIVKAGGFIHAGRVNGSLSLARAIGTYLLPSEL